MSISGMSKAAYGGSSPPPAGATKSGRRGKAQKSETAQQKYERELESECKAYLSTGKAIGKAIFERAKHAYNIKSKTMTYNGEELGPGKFAEILTRRLKTSEGTVSKDITIHEAASFIKLPDVLGCIDQTFTAVYYTATLRQGNKETTSRDGEVCKTDAERYALFVDVCRERSPEGVRLNGKEVAAVVAFALGKKKTAKKEDDDDDQPGITDPLTGARVSNPATATLGSLPSPLDRLGLTGATAPKTMTNAEIIIAADNETRAKEGNPPLTATEEIACLRAKSVSEADVRAHKSMQVGKVIAADITAGRGTRSAPGNGSSEATAGPTGVDAPKEQPTGANPPTSVMVLIEDENERRANAEGKMPMTAEEEVAYLRDKGVAEEQIEGHQIAMQVRTERAADRPRSGVGGGGSSRLVTPGVQPIDASALSQPYERSEGADDDRDEGAAEQSGPEEQPEAEMSITIQPDGRDHTEDKKKLRHFLLTTLGWSKVHVAVAWIHPSEIRPVSAR